MQPTKSTLNTPAYQRLEGGTGRDHPTPTQAVQFAQLAPQGGQTEENSLQRRLQSATSASQQASSSIITDVSLLKDLQKEKIAFIQRVCKSDEQEVSSNTLLSLKSLQQELTSIIRRRIIKKKETIPYLKDDLTSQREEGIFEYRISWNNFCAIRKRFNLIIGRIQGMRSPSQSDLAKSQRYRNFLTCMEEALQSLNPKLEMDRSVEYEKADRGGFDRYNLDLSKIEDAIKGMDFPEQLTSYKIGEISSVISRYKYQQSSRLSQEKTLFAKLEKILNRIVKLEDQYGQSADGRLTLDVLTLQLQLSERLDTLIQERYNSLFTTSSSSVSLSMAAIPVSNTSSMVAIPVSNTSSSSVPLSMATVSNSSNASSSVPSTTGSIPVSNTSLSSVSLSMASVSNSSNAFSPVPLSTVSVPNWSPASSSFPLTTSSVPNWSTASSSVPLSTASVPNWSTASSSVPLTTASVPVSNTTYSSSSWSTEFLSNYALLQQMYPYIQAWQDQMMFAHLLFQLQDFSPPMPPISSTTGSTNASSETSSSLSVATSQRIETRKRKKPRSSSISTGTSSSMTRVSPSYASISSPLSSSGSHLPPMIMSSSTSVRSPLPQSLSPVPLSISATTNSSSSIGGPLPLSLSQLPQSLSPVPLSISATTNSSSSIESPFPSTTTDLNRPLSSEGQLPALSELPIQAPVTSSSNQNPPPPTLTEAHFGSWLYNDQSALGRQMRRSQSVPTFVNFFNEDIEENSIVSEVTERKSDTFDPNEDIN